VVDNRSAVDWSESRFWRTEAERTIPDMAFPSGCWSHFYDLKTDTPRTVNKSLKEAASVRWTTAMVEIVLTDRPEERGQTLRRVRAKGTSVRRSRKLRDLIRQQRHLRTGHIR
jgi:hypothetical protein